MSRLVAISNRTSTPLGAHAGGLAVAVGDALVESGGVWFGWSGDITERAGDGVRVFADAGVEFVLADLNQEEFDGYYLGYANRALWPIFHYRVDLAVFREHDFATYAQVNQRFARLIVKQLRDGDVVWIHDYHFMLLAEHLRREGWTGPIGFFLHTPFPAPEVFQALPEHGEIARALSRCDLIGFQTERDASNFRRYLEDTHDGQPRGDGGIEVFGRVVHARAFPIGIDADDFAELTGSEEALAASARLDRFLGERALIIGVDRMDYSKGLPERFEAVGRLFVNYPETCGTVSFTQVATPSRSKVDEYRALRRELDQLVGHINGDYGDLDWIPLRYLARAYKRAELAGLFRLARVGLVTPLRDGMNLVAKEYVAAQHAENPGVLILSEFAGAAEQLEAAVQVNPHDTDAVADALHVALTMPLHERRARHEALLESVRDRDVRWWRGAFLADLAGVCMPESA